MELAESVVRAPRIAVVIFQVRQERNFIHDDQAMALVAVLRERGLEATLVELSLPPLEAPQSEHLEALEPLLTAAREQRWDLLLYQRFWSAPLFAHLRAALPEVCFACLGGERTYLPGTDYHLHADSADAVEFLARALARGERPKAEELPSHRSPVESARGVGLRHLLRLGPPPPPRPAFVFGSPGCAWSKEVASNPRFEGVPLGGKEVVKLGCSFCTTGGVPRRPAGELLASVLEQLDRLLDAAPETERIQLIDQNPLPYLERLVERVGERAKRPVELLLETRADWFLGGLAVLERALAKAQDRGHRLVLFLLGIENFSPRELELFNKGVSAEENERAVHEYRRLRQRYAGAWGAERAAFGFILYNPWTEPSDLLLNLQAIERTRLDEFRGELARSKLRLYADTALYRKALHEGLLSERFDDEAMDSASRYGYESELRWRFANPATRAIYRMHSALYRGLGRHRELEALREVLHYVQRHPETHEQPVAQSCRALLAQLGPRRAQALKLSAAPRPSPA